MPKRRNPLLQKMLALTALTFGALTRLLPLPVNRFIAVQLGRAAYWVIPRIRKDGLANLNLAYGDALSTAQKKHILKGAVRNLALVAAEFTHMPRLAKQSFAGFVTLEGLENCDLNRGFLLIGAHLGNWEWMASVLASRGIRMAEVVRPFDEPWMNRAVDAVRRGGGIETIAKHEAGTEVMRLLKQGWAVGILVDQSPRENGVPASFFGNACWATIAPVMVAVRSKVPVHPLFMVRGADGRYTMRIDPAIEMVRHGDLRQDMLENTQRCQDILEAMVREHPEQWLWLHRRWKDRPRLRREWDAKMSRGRQPGPGKAPETETE